MFMEFEYYFCQQDAKDLSENFLWYTENDIGSMTFEGIFMKDGFFIDFHQCADNFKKAHEAVKTGFVAERALPVYIFYTLPKPVVIKFLRRNKIIEFFSPTRNRAFAFEKELNSFGFYACDMT